jgi:hypothetical protein
MNKLISTIKVLFFVSLFLPFSSFDPSFGFSNDKYLEQMRQDSMAIDCMFNYRIDSISKLQLQTSLIQSKIDSIQKSKKCIVDSITTANNYARNDLLRINRKNDSIDSEITFHNLIIHLIYPQSKSISFFGVFLMFASSIFETTFSLNINDLEVLLFIIGLMSCFLLSIIGIIFSFYKGLGWIDFAIVTFNLIILVTFGFIFFNSFQWGFYLSIFLIILEFIFLMIKRKPVANKGS